MKWILSLFLCLSASAQLPIIPYNLPSGVSTFFPNSITNTMLYWFELTPTNGLSVNADGTGGVPSDAQGARGWTNMAHVPDIGTTDGGHWVTNYLSGGGKNFNKVRALFNTGIPTRIIPPAVTSTLTNFTMIMVANCSNVVTASQEIYGNANNPPYLDFDASKLTINAGNNVTGPTTIASSTFYIITWKCNGASSEIDTNGVLYVSGDAGIKGTPAGAAPLIAHDRVNQFVGNICRVWTWTNQLNTVDLGNAINQCKTDFGF